MSAIELSIVMPCLNEAATIVQCVEKARQYLYRANISGEIVVADNGSEDGSQVLAMRAGARVVHVSEKGYGVALRSGIAAAVGRFVIMGDADASYSFEHLDGFVGKLRDGADLVMGNRFTGGIRDGAMPLLHRYLGNPVLSFLGRLFFKVRVGDFHCGLRGFNRASMLQLGLTSPGMEFATEMVVKSALAGLRIAEVPTTLSPDGRGRPPHLRTWRDGWRHLRFLLMFSPRWLFLYPGLGLVALGLFLQACLLNGRIRLGSVSLDVHTMLYAATMSVVGIQMLWFAFLAKAYGAKLGLLPEDSRTERFVRTLTLERGLAIGLALLFGGIAMSTSAVRAWAVTGYGTLDPTAVMRTAIPSVTMLLTGMEFIVASFFLGLLRFEVVDSPLFKIRVARSQDKSAAESAGDLSSPG